MVLHTHAHRKLFSLPEPCVIPTRPKENFHIPYACSVALAEGFAPAFQSPDLSIEEQDGLWLSEILKRGSKNVHEALNIANLLNQDIKARRHNDCEL